MCSPIKAFPQFVELLQVLARTTVLLMIFGKDEPHVCGNVVWRCNILSLVLTQRTHDADPWQYMHINYRHNKQSKMNVVSKIMSTYTNYIILWLDANGILKTKMLGVWEFKKVFWSHLNALVCVWGCNEGILVLLAHQGIPTRCHNHYNSPCVHHIIKRKFYQCILALECVPFNDVYFIVFVCMI